MQTPILQESTSSWTTEFVLRRGVTYPRDGLAHCAHTHARPDNRRATCIEEPRLLYRERRSARIEKAWLREAL